MHLSADEREAAPSLAESVDDAVHESLLEVTLGRIAVGEVQEVEDVRVFGDLLR